MKFKLTPETALLSIKIWLHPILCWPVPKNASRKRWIFHNLGWAVAVLILAHLVPASFMHSAMEWPDPVVLTRNMAECLAMFVTCTKIIICRVQHSRLQVAVADLEEYLKKAGPRERVLLDLCLTRCGRFYAFVEVMCFLSTVAFVCGPIILPQPLPGHTEYPFEWKDSPKLKALLYFTHILGCFEITAGAVIDIQVAFLLWVSGVRFEFLAECFQNARSLAEFHQCIETHQKLLTSVNEITIVVQHLALDVMFCTGITNICIGYQLVSHQPFVVNLQFGVMFLVTSLEVAMYAWPADNLAAVSENIAEAIYSSRWFGESQQIMSDIKIIMMRSQKPVTIGISGLIAAINLDFYGRYLTTLFSYFTTLRAVVG